MIAEPSRLLARNVQRGPCRKNETKRGQDSLFVFSELGELSGGREG